MSVSWYPADEVSVSYSGAPTFHALGAASALAYGFMCDDVNVGCGSLVFRRCRYALFSSEVECVLAIRKSRRVGMSVFLIREDGSVMVMAGVRCGLCSNERLFSDSLPQALWDARAVNAAMADAFGGLRPVPHQCLSFAVAVLHNLVCPGHVSFSSYADVIGALGMYSHVSLLGDGLFCACRQPLFSEALPRLDSRRVLELLDLGYALLLTLEVGARLPRADDACEVLDIPHAVVVLKLSDGCLCVIDQRGGIRVGRRDIEGLCEYSDSIYPRPWSFGCVVLGVRQGGNMISFGEFADGVARLDTLRPLDAKTGAVLRTSGVGGVFDSRSSAIVFFVDEFDRLSKPKRIPRVTGDGVDVLEGKSRPRALCVMLPGVTVSTPPAEGASVFADMLESMADLARRDAAGEGLSPIPHDTLVALRGIDFSQAKVRLLVAETGEVGMVVE